METKIAHSIQDIGPSWIYSDIAMFSIPFLAMPNILLAFLATAANYDEVLKPNVQWLKGLFPE